MGEDNIFVFDIPSVSSRKPEIATDITGGALNIFNIFSTDALMHEKKHTNPQIFSIGITDDVIDLGKHIEVNAILGICLYEKSVVFLVAFTKKEIIMAESSWQT